MGSISQSPDQQNREDPTIYKSRSFLRLQSFKQSLVLDLFLRRGLFWQMVRNLRERRSIIAKVQLPPKPAQPWMEPMHLLPDEAPEYPGFLPPKQAQLKKEWEAQKLRYYKYWSLWFQDLQHILSAVLPDNLKGAFEGVSGADKFMDSEYLETFCAACILYDPPETHLLEFAEYHDPPAHNLDFKDGEPDEAAKLVRMRMHPIELLPDRVEELRLLEYFYETLLLELDKRLKPHGLDLRSMIEDIHRDRPGLRQEHSKELEENFYIKVDEHMVEKDVVGAYRTISAALKKRPTGTKPPRNRLVATQCAILYDRHNTTHDSDKRRWQWTYERLAEKYGLPSAQSAKDHVRLGREILKKK